MNNTLRILAIIAALSVPVEAFAGLKAVSSGGGSGGGGSTSITSSSSGLVVSPSPITGTGTIGLTSLVNAQGTAASYTILSSDMGKLVTHNKASAVAVSLPTCNSGSFAIGNSYSEMNFGAGTVTITVAGGAFNGSPTSSTTLALTQNQAAWLTCSADGNWNVFIGAGGSSITFPTTGTVLISAGASSNPTGVTEVDGNCLVGVSGAWASGSCAGTSSSNLGTSVSAASPQVNGDATTGLYTAGAAKVDVAVSGVKIWEWVAGGATYTGTLTSTGATTIASTSANLTLNAGGFNTMNFQVNASNWLSSTGAVLTYTPSASNTSKHYSFSGATDSALTASTDISVGSFLGGSNTRTHATGSLTLQRDWVMTGATHAFAAASTATDIATFGYALPGCGTNGTCTNVSGLYHASTALTATGTITNSYGVNVASDTGATNNYSAKLDGRLLLPNLTTSSSSQTANMCLNGSNEVISDSVACLVSSIRFKDIVAPLGASLDKVMALKPVRFKYKVDFLGDFIKDPNQTHEQIGLVAEDMAAIEPDLVVYEKDGITPHSIRYEQTVALLVKAMQEQQHQLFNLRLWIMLLGTLFMLAMGLVLARRSAC